MSEAAVAVRWLLDQAEPEARRVAVQQIAKVRGREAPELLLRALSDEDWRVRKEATTVAPTLDRREEVVAALTAALEETVNIGLRNAAVEALVSIGPDAVGAVVDSLVRLDADARKLAVEVLGGVADPRGTAALARALHDDDANVRAAAAEALGNSSLAGEASRELATQALVASLTTQDAFLKIAALDSLARLEARLPWSVFEPYSTDPLLRRYAIAAASGAGEPEAVRALARATGDGSPTIAREALLSLGDFIASSSDEKLLESAREAFAASEVGRVNARRAIRDAEDPVARGCALLVISLLRDPDDVPALVEALEEDDVAERAHLALRLFGPGAVAPLLAAARHADPPVRAAALTLAASLPDAPAFGVLDELRRALDERSPEVVSCAVVAIGRLGEAADLKRVARLLKHADERLAAAAVNAVAELAARNVDAARALLESSRAQRADPVVLGCVLLGAIATTQPLDEDDVGLLVRALAHDDARVRRASIEALARAGGEAAADAVVFALADEEHEVQLAAIRALGLLGRAEPLVGVVAGARDPVLAATALRALGEANPEAALDAARPLIAQHDAAIACAAVEAIGQLADGRASGGILPHVVSACEDALFQALEHPDAEVVKVALSLVAELPGVRALARLGLCLDHSSWEVRRLAAELLGHDRSPAAQGLLQARYEREKDPIVRDAIASAVSLRAGPDASRSVERRGTSLHGSRDRSKEGP